MSEILLIAPVLLPLLIAPLVVMLGSQRAGWLLAVLAALLATLASAALLPALGEGPRSYHFGNWPPPFGIEYVLDGLNTPLLLLTNASALLALIAATPATLAGRFAGREPVFYALFLLCLSGLSGILATGDAFNVFVFLEISSLCTYGLVAAGPRPGSALAAFQYLILGTLGGSFVLLGVGFWLQATGTLNMADLAQRLPQSEYSAVALAGSVLLLLGFALKSASFPLQQWLPAVYAAAPWPVTAFLAACATKVAIYAMVRLALDVAALGEAARWLFGLIALVGIVWGALAACVQRDLRRMLAWSSVSQLGYILFAFSLGTAAGVTAAMIQFFSHGAIKGGLFLALGPARSFDDLAGLREREPWRCAMLTLLTMGLLGVPLTAGFAAKWALLSAAAQAGHGIGLGVVIFSSLLAVVYCLRLLEPVWLRSPQRDAPQLPRHAMLLPPALATLAMFALGLTPWAASFGRPAAQALGWAP